MEVISINGREFIPASKAAREVGYTPDYVGQLCREGSISAERVGRSWYVDRAELREHKDEKKRNSRTKAREQVKKAIVEKESKEKELTSEIKKTKTKTSQFEHRYLAHAQPSYAVDSRPLIPDIKKEPKNKVFLDHVVEEAPVLEVSENEVKERGFGTSSDVHRVPITLQREDSRSKEMQHKEVNPAPVRPTLKQEKKPVVLKRKSERVQEDLTEPSQNTSKIPIAALALALVLTLSFFILETKITVQMTDMDGEILKQIDTGYTLDFTFNAAKIGLK